MNNSLAKKAVILVLVLGVVGLIGWRYAKNNVQDKSDVSSEIVLESSQMMEGTADLEMPMSEEEKQEIEEAFLRDGVEMTVLKDVSGGQSVGTAWRQVSESGDMTKFYHKVEVSSLPSLEKGFFYEGWLVSDEGFFSTGRVAEINGQGILYFNEDKDVSEFRGVVITVEPEDGDLAPAKHILEGSF